MNKLNFDNNYYERFRSSPTFEEFTSEMESDEGFTFESDEGFTVMGWVKFEGGSGTVCILFDNTQVVNFEMSVVRFGGGGTIYGFIRHEKESGVSNAFKADVITLGNWHMMAFTFDENADGSLYVDGDLKTGFFSSHGPFNETSNIEIGGQNSAFGPGINGKIRDVSICSPRLTDQQIADAVNMQDYRKLPNVKRYWSLHNPYDPTLRPTSDNTMPSDLRDYISEKHMKPSGLSLASWTKDDQYG